MLTISKRVILLESSPPEELATSWASETKAADDMLEQRHVSQKAPKGFQSRALLTDEARELDKLLTTQPF